MSEKCMYLRHVANVTYNGLHSLVAHVCNVRSCGAYGGPDRNRHVANVSYNLVVGVRF